MTSILRRTAGTQLAISASAMRLVPSLCLGLGLVLSPVVARAQVTIVRTTRFNSPRAAEFGTSADGGVPVDPLRAPVGLRDCACETWRFEGTYMNNVAGATLQFWVGRDQMGCATLANRQPNTSTQTCWQIPSTVATPIATGVGQTLNWSVEVPVRWLLDPVGGVCGATLSGVSSPGSVYFSAILRPPDESSPIAAQQIGFNLNRPEPPFNVAASALEGGARVTWQATGVGGTNVSTDASSGTDGSTSSGGTVAANLRGFYVLCLGGRPASFDAGASGAVCNAESPVDASVDDAGSVDGATADAGFDAGSTVDSGTSTTDSGTGASACSAVESLPADFDPNNDEDFQRFVCSGLIQLPGASFNVSGLANGRAYRFAVVSVDNAGNRSVVSRSSDCAVPALVTDFWERYRQGGGRANPGFCSASPGAIQKSGGALFALAAAGSVLTLRGRRRRRDRVDGSSRGAK